MMYTRLKRKSPYSHFFKSNAWRPSRVVGSTTSSACLFPFSWLIRHATPVKTSGLRLIRLPTSSILYCMSDLPIARNRLMPSVNMPWCTSIALNLPNGCSLSSNVSSHLTYWKGMMNVIPARCWTYSSVEWVPRPPSGANIPQVHLPCKHWNPQFLNLTYNSRNDEKLMSPREFIVYREHENSASIILRWDYIIIHQVHSCSTISSRSSSSTKFTSPTLLHLTLRTTSIPLLLSKLQSFLLHVTVTTFYLESGSKRKRQF